MIQFIRNLIQTFKEWFLFWRLEGSFNKEVDQNVNMWSNKDPVAPTLEVEQENQQKYHNGIALMKSRLRSEIKGGKSFDQTMNQYRGSENFYTGNRDLLSLATDEDEQRRNFRKLKESAVVFSGADVKTEADKTKMIDKRIGHYTELQKQRMSRDHLRKAREAHNVGDFELHKILMEEWNQVYGNRGSN